MAEQAEASKNDPRPYAVWEVKEGDGLTWLLLGTFKAKSNPEARRMAASVGEADGKPRTGKFFAAALGYVQGEAFKKEMQPVVDSEELSLVPEEAPEEAPGEAPPAQSNGRSRRKPARTADPVGV